jgi:hypothetical protein
LRGCKIRRHEIGGGQDECRLARTTPCISCQQVRYNEGGVVMGQFGLFTRWAVVFLVIFVLFILLIPGYGTAGVATGGCGCGR